MYFLLTSLSSPHMPLYSLFCLLKCTAPLCLFVNHVSLSEAELLTVCVFVCVCRDPFQQCYNILTVFTTIQRYRVSVHKSTVLCTITNKKLAPGASHLHHVVNGSRHAITIALYRSASVQDGHTTIQVMLSVHVVFIVANISTRFHFQTNYSNSVIL